MHDFAHGRRRSWPAPECQNSWRVGASWFWCSFLEDLCLRLDHHSLHHPAARWSSRRSSLEIVHWTISFACGEPLLTQLPAQKSLLQRREPPPPLAGRDHPFGAGLFGRLDQKGAILHVIGADFCRRRDLLARGTPAALCFRFGAHAALSSMGFPR